MKHNIIYKQNGIYASFPLLNQEHNSLYVGFFKAPIVDHTGIFNWQIMRSDDNGEIWKKTKITGTLLDWNFSSYSSRDISDRYVGTISGISPRYILAGSRGFMKRNNELVISKSFYYELIDLIDKKTTIDKVIKTVPGIVGFVTFPRIIEIDVIVNNLIILIPAYGILENGKNKPFVLRSNDSGLSWELISMFSNNIDGNEMAFIPTNNGILALIRTDKASYMMESWSIDYGLTWSYPLFTNIKGTPPHLLRLKDNRILVTYGYRETPMGIRARISEDEGKSWQQEFILRDDGGTPCSLHKTKWWSRKKIDGQWDLGYPVSIQLEDESILTVYYFTDNDGITHIASTKWRI